MTTKFCRCNIAILLFCVWLIAGCGKTYDHEGMSLSVGIQENKVIEIYNDGEILSDFDFMIAQVSLQQLLTGNPILYNCFRTDGWVFEWLISDYKSENLFMEEGILIVSREGNAEEAQIIRVAAEGGAGTRVSADKKFVYEDVNFDGMSDLLISTGCHGVQGVLTYYCFLQTENGFTECAAFTDISNAKVDAENKVICGQWRNCADSHSWAEYGYQNGTYVMVRELCEKVDYLAGEDVLVWTVNGEEIGRSDTLSEEEIDNLLYNENSTWQLNGDRWLLIYP